MELQAFKNIEIENVINNSRVRKSISNYARMGIDIKILENDNNTIKVKIQQKRLLNGYILNQKQLVNRVKNIFNPMGLKTKVIPVVWGLSVETITPEYIAEKMNTYGIKRNDIIKQLAIDKSSLSLYLNGRKAMNKQLKSAFFFYFLTYELNTELRENL